MSGLEEKIQSYLAEIITEPEYFIVDIVISENDKLKIVVLVDGDNGVSIDFCASVSRQLGHKMEEDEVLEKAYVLEVSSPGLDHPLMNARQYQKNIGRKVKVDTKESKSIRGELLEVSEDFILVNQEIKEKGKKKIKHEETKVPFDIIDKTKVLVSFK
ncbi:ribosome maturation factor RimP [Marivirga arenosa]|uniref:Ribosome maturation factor RimP n=1 Tax=Marivirga arenosa TaxID=3059076 RepID=A0AA49GGW7_9BACT|nr:ribosome maturation factor RimP [Marivirga sp. ABR2-2]WKK86256.2 ribosome maturation factor RimP [Marivirga sp. ABR2-2]